MKNTTVTLLGTAALIAVAGCSKKPPAQLPPAPPSEVSQPTPPAQGEVGSTVVPGSRADMLAQAGTDTVLFVTDSSDLDGQAEATLTRQAEWLRKFPQVRVTVEGHCDERGTREYNLALGDRRANSAKNFLVAQGVSAARISVISYGKERPAAQGSDEGAWAQNRRAVTVVPE